MNPTKADLLCTGRMPSKQAMARAKEPCGAPRLTLGHARHGLKTFNSTENNRGFAIGWFSIRVVLADVENQNEGTFRGSPGPKTGMRAHSPKPPFYETALLFPLETRKKQKKTHVVKAER